MWSTGNQVFPDVRSLVCHTKELIVQGTLSDWVNYSDKHQAKYERCGRNIETMFLNRLNLKNRKN